MKEHLETEVHYHKKYGKKRLQQIIHFINKNGDYQKKIINH